MKATILTLVFLMSSYCLLFSQNAPSIVADENSFYGQEKLIPKDTALRKNKANKSYYETENWIDYTNVDSAIKQLQSKNNSLLDEIRKESYPVKDSSNRKKLSANREEILKLKLKKDSLHNEYVKDFIEIKNIVFPFGVYRSRALFDLIYHEDSEKTFNFLNNTGFNIGDNTGSLYTELVTGHMHLVRVSLGTMVASSSSTDSDKSNQEEAYQRLTTYGGNTVLTLEYPLIYGHSPNNDVLFLTRIITKGTADFPALGTPTESWAGSVSLGIDAYLSIATSNKKIKFFGVFNTNRFLGSSTFQSNLGIDNDSFSFGQLKLGVTFSNVSLSFIVRTFSSEATLRNRNVIAGGQILH